MRTTTLSTSLLLATLAFTYSSIAPSILAQPVAGSNSVSPQPLEDVRQIRLEVFVRGDLPAAAQVGTYAQELRQKQPGLQVVIHDVLTDREQLVRLHELSTQFGREKPVVPAFYGCQRMYFGFKDAESSGPRIEELWTADVYTRTTCSRCQAAKRFIADLAVRWPAIHWRVYEVSADAAARGRWEAMCRARGTVPGLPTIVFAGKVSIGYQGDELTGAELEQLLESCSVSTAPRNGPQPDDSSSRFPLDLAPRLVSLASQRRTLSLAVTNQRAEEDTTASEAAFPPHLDLLELPDEADESDMGEGSESLPSSVQPASDQSIQVPLFGKLRVRELGMPLFSLAVGLIDGFNPCAMWVLVFLLSVLVNIKDRRKIVAIAGTFVIVSGLAYFAFMAAWLNLFLLIGIARPVQIVLGCVAVFIGVINVKDFFAFKKGISLTIPESTKPGLYRRVRDIVNAKYLSIAVAGAVSLAIVVNMVELLCTAGLPAIFTQILSAQNLPSWQNYLYLAIYIGAYMADDTILLTVIVVTLSRRRLQESEGRWLKFISGIVILILGAVMIFRPSWLEFTSVISFSDS